MEILGLEKVSLVDYDGLICATIFTGGCNFLCPFCHNNGLVRRHLQTIDEGEVLGYLAQRKGLLDAVTISGGEPTLQPDLAQFMRKVRGMGYKIKLDTNGANPEVVADLINQGLVDHIALDIKNDFADYNGITGLKRAPVEKVKTTLGLLKDSGISYELRTTLVSQFHKRENIERLARDLEGHGALYLQKFEDSGDLVGDIKLSAVPLGEAEEFKRILEEKVGKVYFRGY